MRNMAPKGALRVLERLNAAGFEAYFVGGCVRDILRGAAPHDWDICTAARPEEAAQCFDSARVRFTGRRHGTITVLEDGMPYEITTFRVDGAYSDGRRPDQVRFVSRLEEDLARRDFTMNAIAMDASGGMRDPFGGQADIKNHIIRCVGVPNLRFQEDGLRVLRALRFASVLDFRMEEETAGSVRHSSGRLACVAAERIQEELRKLLLGRAVGRVLLEYGDVLCAVWREFCSVVFAPELWGRTVRALERSAPELPVRLTLLLSGLEKDADVRGLLDRLRFDAETARLVSQLTALSHVRLEPEDKVLRRWLKELGLGKLRLLLAVQRGAAETQAEEKRVDEVSARVAAILEEGQCFSREMLAVDGRDVTAAGIAQGPAVGRVLDLLLEQVMDGVLPNDRARLLSVLAGLDV